MAAMVALADLARLRAHMVSAATAARAVWEATAIVVSAGGMAVTVAMAALVARLVLVPARLPMAKTAMAVQVALVATAAAAWRAQTVR